MIRQNFNSDRTSWFRDRAQLKAVRDIVQDRLADDRWQQECRYLMRFWWHLGMSYQEVCYSELQKHLSPEKLAILEDLFDAIDASPDQVDAWIARYEDLPLVEPPLTGVNAWQ